MLAWWFHNKLGFRISRLAFCSNFVKLASVDWRFQQISLEISDGFMEHQSKPPIKKHHFFSWKITRDLFFGWYHQAGFFADIARGVGYLLWTVAVLNIFTVYLLVEVFILNLPQRLWWNHSLAFSSFKPKNRRHLHETANSAQFFFGFQDTFVQEFFVGKGGGAKTTWLFWKRLLFLHLFHHKSGTSWFDGDSSWFDANTSVWRKNDAFINPWVQKDSLHRSHFLPKMIETCESQFPVPPSQPIPSWTFRYTNHVNKITNHFMHFLFVV